MTKKQIFLTTIKNSTDGASIDPLTLKPVNTQSGYFVSITDNERVRADYRIVAKLKNQAKSLNLRKYCIGYWRDGKTGKHYFDLSLHMRDKIEALKLAKIFDQKAIFDVAKCDVIYC